MEESKKKDPVRLNRIAETSDEGDLSQSGTHSESESSPPSSETDTEGSELVGSQYSSDAADDEYMERVGFMQDMDSASLEHMNVITSPLINSEGSGNTNSEQSASSSVLNLDFGEYMRTMTIGPDGNMQATLRPKSVPIKEIGTRPSRTSKDNRCLTAFIKINGFKAFVLFDSGSTADAISPDFARIAKLPIFQLENPVTLQLGTKGSRLRISFGCTTSYSLSPDNSVSETEYFDIANIDRYDAVIGTVFMRRHSISLHFSDDTVRVNGKSIPTLEEGEESAEIARRYQKTVSREIQLEDGEQVEIRKHPHKYGTVESLAQKKRKSDPLSRK